MIYAPGYDQVHHKQTSGLDGQRLLETLTIMLRSGDIELHVAAGTFRNAGWLAVDWSSRAADAAGAYRLVVYSTVYPSGDTTNNRYNGFPLRWIIACRGG